MGLARVGAKQNVRADGSLTLDTPAQSAAMILGLSGFEQNVG
jgi:hypothetical protein